MTKNIIRIVIVFLVLVITVMVWGFSVCANANQVPVEAKEKQYVVRAEVVNINKTNPCEVECEDSSGNIWSFYAETNEDYFENDFVILLMDSNETATIYDDEVISVHFDPFSY